MFPHLKLGRGAAWTGQVRLCSDMTETVIAGSTLLEAFGALPPIGSKILRLEVTVREVNAGLSAP